MLGFVEVVNSEFDILHIPETICLPFHCLDFVVETFKYPLVILWGGVKSHYLFIIPDDGHRY